MQDTKMNLPRTNCPTCGKTTPRRDIRDTKPQYCSRICANLSRFKTRFSGSQAGPYDRPVDIKERGKWTPGDSSDLPSGA